MDDFLHNLRSGKLKQPDRSNRQYSDQQYKGGPRRNNNNMMDRRKRDFDNKESFEKLNAIKEVLESLSETQKRMAVAYQERTRAEERKARAMELLAKNIYRMLNPDAKNVDELFAVEQTTPETRQDVAPPSNPAPMKSAETEQAAAAPEAEEEEEPESLSSDMEALSADEDEVDDAEESIDSENEKSRLTEVDRQALFATIHQMRDEGAKWEKIARHIASQGYPTLSGKGVWRGVTVKNLYEKMAE